VKEHFATKTYEEWVSLSQGSDTCIEPILTVQEVMQHPQHQARGTFQYHPNDSDSKPSPLPAQIVLGPRLSSHPPSLLSRASYHGEHNEEVLKAVGVTDSELSDMYPFYKKAYYAIKQQASAVMLGQFYKNK
jgi:alpha-methylacyl-CoA racemase